MKLTKRIMTIAACAVMAASSMVGISSSAYDADYNNDMIISYEGNGIVPYAARTKRLTMSPTPQEKGKWCWAACIEMVLNYYGVTKTQTEIVTQVKGSDVNEGGTSAEIASGLNAFYSSGNFNNETNSTQIKFSYIKNKLAVNKPVILTGTLSNGDGHAVVCYGYDTSGSNYILYIIDPAVQERGTLTASSSNATTYTMSVSGQPSTSYSTAAYVAATN